MKKFESCSTIFLSKSSEFYTRYLLLVKDFKTGTRNIANLQVAILIANKIGRNHHPIF